MNELIRKYPDLLKRVVMEITEGEAISSSDMEFKIETIRRTGSKIALDDFGSGYSSEGTLLNMEVNIVKLDMGLVSGIDKNRDKQELAANLIHYCKERNILVLAEVWSGSRRFTLCCFWELISSRVIISDGRSWKSVR